MGFWLSSKRLRFQKQGSGGQLSNWGICSSGEWSNFWQSHLRLTLQKNLLMFFLTITILMDVTLYLWLWYCILRRGALLCCSGLLNNEYIFFDPFFLIKEIVLPFGQMSVNYSCLFVLLYISVPAISRAGFGAWKPANRDFCVASARGGCRWGSQWKSQIWPNA